MTASRYHLLIGESTKYINSNKIFKANKHTSSSLQVNIYNAKPIHKYRSCLISDGISVFLQEICNKKLNANCYITKALDLDQFIKVVRSVKDFCLTIVKLPPKV